MELRQLEYFQAVVEAGSFLGASERLHVAQPTVWRQVKALERELSVPLFERSGRRVKPTSAGRVLLPLAEQVLAGADKIELLAAELKVGRAGVVTVECAHPHVQTFLAPLIGGFHAARAEVKIEIQGRPGLPHVSRVIDGHSDFITSLPSGDSRVAGLELGSARVVVVTPDTHPWRHRPAVELSELSGVSVLLGHESSLARNLLEPTLLAHQIELDVAYQSLDTTSLVALARAGLGLAIMAEDHLPGDSSGWEWPVLMSDGAPLVTPVWLYWSSERALSPSAASFVRYVKHVIAGRRRTVSETRIRWAAQ